MLIIASIYFTIALLALALEVMFGFVFPTILLCTCVGVLVSALWLLVTIVKRQRFFSLALHTFGTALVSVALLVLAGVYLNETRMKCAQALSSNPHAGHEAPGCNVSENLVYDRVAYSGVAKRWSISLYGATIGLYYEMDQRWEFERDRFLERAFSKLSS